jgi:hypothetical protein
MTRSGSSGGNPVVGAGESVRQGQAWWADGKHGQNWLRVALTHARSCTNTHTSENARPHATWITHQSGEVVDGKLAAAVRVHAHVVDGDGAVGVGLCEGEGEAVGRRSEGITQRW